MARSIAPSFVVELPLAVDSKQESELLSKFQAGRQLYNACLNEAMARMELVRNSEAYKAAKKVPRDQKKKRSLAFAEARKVYRYSDYHLQAYATRVSNKSLWIAEKLDSNANPPTPLLPKGGWGVASLLLSKQLLHVPLKLARR